MALTPANAIARALAMLESALGPPELWQGREDVVAAVRREHQRVAEGISHTFDSAFVALDAVERLLAEAGSPAARDIGAMKTELGRSQPVDDPLLSAAPAGLRPWREVIQPHDDVARGRFALAEFAADLHQVAQGEGADEYADPVAFFARTFLTGGLCQLLTTAVERLAGGAGSSPVVDLQTSFGGGKTHSMIALYHLFSGTSLDQFPAEVRELVEAAGVTALPEVRRAVLVGTELKAGQRERKPDGTELGTMWGELAWQLGGAEGFEVVAEADRSRTNPGDALRLLFSRYAPCLILIDEWVAYARALYADDSLLGGTFDTHFSFAQALTQAARSTPGVLLVVSVPASSEGAEGGVPIGSEAEVGGVGGREALRRLRVVVGRMESSWRPASAQESFEIVRRRLFQPVDSSAAAHRQATARAFGDFYRKQADEFPAECRERSYEDRMIQAYPVHPELFARLYEDWSTLERFQRTRGVLRLMATVVHSLWASGDQSPLILPASVPLADPAVNVELTRNLDDIWKPIIDADVDGPRSLPRALDDEFKNLGRYLATRRVARTVFLGSAPLAGSPNQGLDAPHVRLGCAMPGEHVAIYGDALNRLADRATYFYVGGGRSWYGTQPSVSRLARDRAERLASGDRHDVRAAVVERLRVYEDRARRAGGSRSNSAFAAVHAAPDGPADVADLPEARLVVLGPSVPHMARSEESLALKLAKDVLASRGTAPRDFRNMLVFLAADQRRVDDLEQAVAEHLAWKSIVADSRTLGLEVPQSSQAADRTAETERIVEVRLAEAYQWLLVPRQPDPTGPVVWESIKADATGDLVERAAAKLEMGGGLYRSYPPVLLRLQLDGPLASLWEKGWVTVSEVWDAYARYLYLHRLRDLDVLRAAVAMAPASTTWDTEGLAVADAHVERDGQLAFVGLTPGGGAVTGGVRGTSLLVRPDVAMAQQEAERLERAASYDEPDADEPPGTPIDRDAAARSLVRRFYGLANVEPERLGRDAGRIAQEVVAHLVGLVGTDVEISIEIRAYNRDGFSDEVVQVVGENASALRLRAADFESS